MDKEKIKRHLIDFQERIFLNLKERDIKLKDSSKIQAVIGARRVGKTYLFFNKIRALEGKGIGRKQIIYLNFENPVINNVSYKDIKDIIELHWSLFPETINKKLYLFIDEPQSIDQWELAVRELYDDYNCNIFITGSSSKLLSKEISTTLRGRSLTTVLLPLSFKEFLKFKNFNIVANKISTKSKAQLMNYLKEFLKFGSYPEIVPENDKNEKLKILKDYFDLTIYKDLIDRYNIKNTLVIKWLINYLVSSIAKESSLNKIYLNLKSKGIKLSKNTLYEYFSMLEDSFFIFALRRFEGSIKSDGLSIPKIYLNDIGFLNLFSVEDYGKRMENIVFLEIIRKRNNNPLLDVSYWKSSDGKEVDFIVREGRKVKSAIQVCYSFADESTKKREINSLLSCLDYFKLNEGMIITEDYEDVQKIAGKTIKIIPVWKWLFK
ncbi:MAG: ATP-binding protein [Nanoarchaeota archaeon]|nr:ATP-binding protein [Nanoarchaeota archaeon]